MEVHCTEARSVGDGGRDLLAKGDDHEEVRGGSASGIDIVGADQGKILRERILGDRGGGELATPAGRPIGLRDYGENLVAGGAQGLQCRESKLTAASKQDLRHGCSHCRHDGPGGAKAQMRRRPK